MSPTAYENLRKLHDRTWSHLRKDDGLMRELRHLETIGYATVQSFDEISDEDTDLASFVNVTELGQEFIRLRQELEDKGSS